MRLTPTQKVVALAALLFLATAAIWWLVGFQIGKGILEEAGGGASWRASYGWREGGASRLLFVALLSVVSLSVSGAAQGPPRWALLAGLGLGAALATGAREGALAGTILFVLSVAAVDEASEGRHWIAAAALGIVIAFAESLDLSFTTGQAALAVVLRGLFFWLPLLAGPRLLDRRVLGRIAGSSGS